MSKRTKNIIYVLVALLLIVVFYFLFLKKDSNDDVLVSNDLFDSVSEETNLVEAEILGLLATLRSIEFNDALFSDEIFKSLIDFSIELTPQTPGRVNPFAPIGSDSSFPVEDENTEVTSKNQSSTEESSNLDEFEEF